MNNLSKELPLLWLKQLSKQYAQQPILQSIDLTLHAGDALALMGDSGSGKSTLLHLIAGLETPDGGEIWLGQQAVHQFSAEQSSAMRRQAVSLVFQQYNLIPTLTAGDNIRFPRRLLNLPEQDDYLSQLLEGLGVMDFMHKLPSQLSGGQQQRVAIARALAHQPKLLLADEPTGNLDQALSHQVMSLLAETVRQSATSLIMVTHSQEMAEYLPRIIRLDQGALHALDPASSA